MWAEQIAPQGVRAYKRGSLTLMNPYKDVFIDCSSPFCRQVPLRRFPLFYSSPKPRRVLHCINLSLIFFQKYLYLLPDTSCIRIKTRNKWGHSPMRGRICQLSVLWPPPWLKLCLQEFCKCNSLKNEIAILWKYCFISSICVLLLSFLSWRFLFGMDNDSLNAKCPDSDLNR